MRRLVFPAMVLVLVCAAIEAVSFLGILVVTSQPFSWERLGAAKRDAAAAASAVAPAAGASSTLIVPHPYVGFVYNPEFDPAGAARLHGVPVSAWGFLDDKAPLRQRSEREVVIGIFGGSVAFWYSVQGVATMLEELARVPAYAGKTFVIVRTALGGFKQPQQAMALNYLLALGGHFDIVINFDGFNEVALSPRDMGPGAAYAFYPRDWGNMLASEGDVNRLRMVGEITYLQKRRGEFAATFLRPVLAQSITANFCWVLFDRRHAGLIDAAQVRLNGYRPAAGVALPYAARGPSGAFKDLAGLERATIAVWRQSSLQMAQLARANGAKYFHFLQPNQYVDGSKPVGDVERKVAFLPPGNHYEKAVREGFPLLRVAGAEMARQGVAFHDLTMAFAGIEQPLYIDNCCHVSPQGNLLLGRAIGQAVRSEIEREAPR